MAENSPPLWMLSTLQDESSSGVRPVTGADLGEAVPVLLMLQGAERGRRIALVHGSQTLGRSPEATVLIPDERISRVHCRIWVSGGSAALEDCESRNGTFLNGERVDGAVPVPPQSQIRIGRTVLKLVYRTAAELAFDEELSHAASTDPLTGLPNRRSFFERARVILEQRQRGTKAPAVLLLDVDHFKLINDQHGHAAGDEVLRSVATALRAQCRQGDIVCRFGGEELLLLLPAGGLDGAERVAERLRQAIEATVVSWMDAEIRVTASIGVGEHNLDEDLDSLIARVDAALYEAKAAGRNRVALARPAPPPLP